MDLEPERNGILPSFPKTILTNVKPLRVKRSQNSVNKHESVVSHRKISEWNSSFQIELEFEVVGFWEELSRDNPPVSRERNGDSVKSAGSVNMFKKRLVKLLLSNQ